MAPPACERDFKDDDKSDSSESQTVCKKGSLSTYMVTVKTGLDVAAIEYETQAGLLLNLLETVFNKEDNIAACTKNADVTSSATEAIVACDTDGRLLAQCVLAMEGKGDARIQLDKPKLRALLAREWPWLTPFKMEKRWIGPEWV